MTDDVIEPSSSEEVSQDSGLLDNVNVEPAANTDPNATAISHLDTPEDDDGPLERPDWWPENFWKKDEAEPDLQAILALQAVDDDGNEVSKSKKELPSITDERFTSALAAIKKGTYTVESLKETYKLTPEQEAQL